MYRDSVFVNAFQVQSEAIFQKVVPWLTEQDGVIIKEHFLSYAES